MPVGYGVGDHWLIQMDFQLEMIISAAPTKIVGAAARRLNNKLPRVTEK